MPNGEEQPRERKKSKDLFDVVASSIITQEFLQEAIENYQKNNPILEFPDIDNNNLRINETNDTEIIIEANEVIGNSFINTYNQLKNGYKTCSKLIDSLDEENRALDTNLQFYIIGNKQGNKLLQDKNAQVIQLEAQNRNLQGEVDNLNYELGERDKQIKEKDQVILNKDTEIAELRKAITDHGVNEIKDIKNKTDNLLNLVNNVAPSHWKENITLVSTILLIPLTIYGLVKNMWSKDQDKKNAEDLAEAVALVKENIKKD